MAQLGIEHIPAYSPEARGRSERLFRTLQDRLPKDLALAGITTPAAANLWIGGHYLAEHNARFAVPAEQPGLAFVPDRASAARDILCIQEDRQVGNDNTIKWRGCIVWMLRALGHARSSLVDGGAAALLADGPLAIAPPPALGDFVAARDARHTITRTALRRRIGAADLAIVDSRTAGEYAGATPHGEARGGHIAGARHLPHRALMRADGRLLPPAQIRARLAAAGARADTEVVAYCTGGVRSAWLTAVLIQLGYRAHNYAGSMWEWSAAPEATHPLIRDA